MPFKAYNNCIQTEKQYKRTAKHQWLSLACSVHSLFRTEKRNGHSSRTPSNLKINKTKQTPRLEFVLATFETKASSRSSRCSPLRSRNVSKLLWDSRQTTPLSGSLVGSTPRLRTYSWSLPLQ